MRRQSLLTNVLPPAAHGALAICLLTLGVHASQAQVVPADANGEATSSEILLTRGHHGPGMIPHESPSTPLGCYGCLTGGQCGDCGGGNCGGPGCIPGRLDCCEPCVGRTVVGRLLCALHHSLCCPDPCYEPCFIPAANAGFFLDSAKPVTQTRFRYDANVGGPTPTRGGYYWRSAGAPGNVPFTAHDLVLENEFAIDRFSIFVSTPWRIAVGTGGAGYSDMRLGTKSLLIDTELLLASFQFTTYFPTGNAASGLGNNNFGLEPSFLLTLKVMTNTYFQVQLAEWIGVRTRESCFHYHFSLNHTLTAPRRDMQLIGSMEYGSYVFPNGSLFYNIGPGFRFHFCNKVDVGFGMQFRLSDEHYLDQFYRTEVRWRF